MRTLKISRSLTAMTCALAVMIAVTVTPRLRAIDYFETDFDIVDASPSQQPADLLHPSNLVTARKAYFNGTGTLIAENWLITANHVQAEDNLDPFWFVPNSSGTMVPYYGKVFRFENQDIALVRLSLDENGDHPTQFSNYVPVADFIADPSSTFVTIAGYGDYGEVSEQNIESRTPGYPATGALHWGQNYAIFNGNVDSGAAANFDLPGSPNYVPYEARGEFGDSGGGWFIRDGWDWKVTAVTQGGGPEATATVAGAVTNANIIEWIHETLGAELPSYTASAKPQATTNWIGSSGGSWGNSANWSNGLPDIDAPASSIVDLDNGAYVTANGQVSAVDILINDATLELFSGSATHVDSLYVGADTGTFGHAGQYASSANVQTRAIYVGHKGTGDYQITGGEQTTDLLTVGKEGTGSYLMYHIFSDLELNAKAVVLGDESGSSGTFQMMNLTPSDQAATKQVVVGNNGTGTFEQLGGSHTITAAGAQPALTIGRNAGSDGLYKIDYSTANLTVNGVTVIGDRGDGEFQLASGVHTQNGDLIVAPTSGGSGSYLLTGGSLVVSTNTIVGGAGGIFEQSGGTHTTKNMLLNTGGTYAFTGGTLNTANSTLTGTLDVSGASSGAINITGLADWRSPAAVIKGSNIYKPIVVQPGGLLVVSNGSFLDKVNTTGAQPPHYAGTTLVVDQYRVSVDAAIADRVEVLTGGEVSAPANGATVLNGGIKWTGTGVVDLGAYGKVVIDQGRTTGTPSIIAPDPSVSSVPIGVQLTADGKLVAKGSNLALRDPTNLSTPSFAPKGMIEVGPGIGDLGLNGNLILWSNYPGSADASTNSLAIDITAGGHDRLLVEDPLQVQEYFVVFAGTLQITSPDLESFGPNDSFEVVTAGSFSPEFLRVQGDQTWELSNGANAVLAAVADSTSLTLIPTLSGDFNRDGVVNNADYSVWTSHFGDSGMFSDGDGNQDGWVDSIDYWAWALNVGATWPTSGPVPEPSALALAALALSRVFVARRRT